MMEKKHSFADARLFRSDQAIPLFALQSVRHHLKRLSDLTRKGVEKMRLTVFAVLIVLVPSSQLAKAAIDAVQVQRAIDRGIAFLRQTQNDRGGWSEFGGQSCGLSSLCTLALLNAGVSRDDPDMTRALRYLRGCTPAETYSVALQTLVFCQLGAAGDLPRIRRNVELLVKEQKKFGQEGAWGYGGGRSSGDPSNAQFAILALGAAQDRGIEVDPQVFQRALKYWIRRQTRSGGWGYGGGQSATGSMTCAGIASIIIARGRLSGLTSEIDGDQIRCCGGADDKSDPVAAGLNWLGRSFNLEVNPGGGPGTFFYYLYALERVGRLSGRRFIGQHDWYREGAERLIGLQDGFQGFWSGTAWEDDRNIATSFALLFLSKGKRQVVIGQLRYGDRQVDRRWQRHPDAMRQLVRHVERDWGRDLTWQTVESERATVVDLLQTPVLIISGREGLEFSDALSQRLKEYVDQGGTILFDADAGAGCGEAAEFETSVRQLCQLWFDGAKLQRLPPGHPVWFAERKVDLNSVKEDEWIYGVQACCRTAVFYSPKTLSCRWELSDILFRRGEESPNVRSQIDTSIRIGQNIIAYATGRELKDKLEQRMLLEGSVLDAGSRGSVRLAVLGIDAGGQEARRALPNAAAIIRRRVDIPLAPAAQPVAFDRDSLKEVMILWIHGRTEFELTDAQREVLSDFIQNNGVIIGSAICGNEAFANAFRRELALVLADSPLEAMPAAHPALTPTFDGYDIRSVTIRMPKTTGSGQAFGRRTGPPLLETAIVDNVTAVFFSPLDLSCALESPNSVRTLSENDKSHENDSYRDRYLCRRTFGVLGNRRDGTTRGRSPGRRRTRWWPWTWRRRRLWLRCSLDRANGPWSAPRRASQGRNRSDA